ncbi:hypothetical protein Fot_04766 [Forsythia ovata]|uniref:Uncharacterized protein n=1 Tax=Forsythia ovata TaxID=205694 RepID=A0ABD1XE18_9LAMI
MSYENADSQNMSDPQTDPQIMDEAQSLPDHDEEVPRVMLAKSFHSLLFAMLRRGLQGLAETLSLRVLFANHEGKDLNSEIHIPWKAIKSEGESAADRSTTPTRKNLLSNPNSNPT